MYGFKLSKYFINIKWDVTCLGTLLPNQKHGTQYRTFFNSEQSEKHHC